MLSWALVFLIGALVAGLFGFGGVASASAGIAKIIFCLFVLLSVIALLIRALRDRGKSP